MTNRKMTVCIFVCPRPGQNIICYTVLHMFLGSLFNLKQKEVKMFQLAAEVVKVS